MNANDLYQASLKMLNDKYKIKEFSKEEFIEIYKEIYNNNQIQPNNNQNKEVLLKIKKKFDEKSDTPDIELKIKEIESLRNSILNIKPITYDQTEESIIKIPQTPIIIDNKNQIHKYKTFLINSYRNNFKLSPNIDINSHMIYPCCLSIPSDIKNKTPYIILLINDGNKQINYIYNPIIINKSNWDIWKPITNDYIDLTLNNNNWTISLNDFTLNSIDFNEYQVQIIDILEYNSSFSLNVNKLHLFNINDKIKIIMNNGETIDNQIIGLKDNRLIINKGILDLENFIDAKIINYKYYISLTFKYHTK